MPKANDRKTKTLRSDLRLPYRCEDFSVLDDFAHWYIDLWQFPSAHADEASLGLLRAYASMLVDTGLPPAAAIDCLCSYWMNPERDSNSVSVSAQRFVDDGRKSTISFNKMTRLAIDTWRRPSDWRLKITYQFSPSPRRLAKLVNSKLKSSFRSLACTEPRYAALRFSDVTTLGQVIAQSRGIEPYLISVLDGNTRPTDYIGGVYGLSDISREAFSHVLIKSTGLTLRSVRPKASGRTLTDELELDLPPSWVADAKAMLRDLCNTLGASIRGHVNTPEKRRRARQVLDEFRTQARSTSSDDSILCLAIDYAENRFADGGKIKASSLRAYLERSVICGFLANDESYDMSAWDTDDLIENLEERLAESRLSMRSKNLILDAYTPLLRFLTSRLGLAPVSIKGLRADFVSGAGQWQLVSPHAIDKVIQRLGRDPDPRLRQSGIVLALGYYGGLRTGDIKNLTLADIVFNERLPDLDVEICRGKSANTRRRMPFHALAPIYVQSLIREFWTGRLGEFPNRNILSKIPLLGPESSVECYAFGSIARLARHVLKQAFGPGANIHTLRHCCCSNLVLRWYALRHWDILQDLRDASHETYQPALRDQFDRYFSLMPIEDGAIRPHDMISMIKLTGHASPTTLFQYYVHSFGAVQAHAARGRESIIESVAIHESTLRSIIPNMRSAKSRSKIKKKTFGGVIEYLERQHESKNETVLIAQLN